MKAYVESNYLIPYNIPNAIIVINAAELFAIVLNTPISDTKASNFFNS